MLVVLRLGHRPNRDKRVTTHVFLTARALGASQCVYSGERDSAVEGSVKKLCARWGGSFKVRFEKRWRGFLKRFRGARVHLTMYGLPLRKEIDKIRHKKNVLVIVGAGKVPREVYLLADYNVSVTNQPHSEVAALAVFLHEFFQGRELDKKFSGWKIKALPENKKKTVATRA